MHLRKPLIYTLLTALALMALSGCYALPLEGEIGAMASRYKGIQEKISLVVMTSKANPRLEEVAGGPSGLTIECTSTRCATIREGSCHSFACKVSARFFEPSVVECKHKKEILCPK